MHDFKGDNDLEIIFSNIIVYMYLLTFTVILFMLYRKFHKYYNYILFLCPTIPILDLLYRIYQTRNLVETDIELMLFLYFVLLFITIIFMKKMPYELGGKIVGKEKGSMEDDYYGISILYKHVDEGDIDLLIDSIIQNFLKYGFVKSSYIYDGDNKYKISHYRRLNSYSHIYENILQAELCIEVTEDFKLINIIDDYYYCNDERNAYNLNYIYQYSDDGDQISQLPSNFEDVFLTLRGVLPEDTKMYYHKENDITPIEIKSLFYRLFEKCFIIKYGTLIDKAEIKLKEILTRIKEPYKKPLKYVLYFIIGLLPVIYIYNNYIKLFDAQTIVMIFIGLPAFIYYIIKVYELIRGKNKKSSQPPLTDPPLNQSSPTDK